MPFRKKSPALNSFGLRTASANPKGIVRSTEKDSAPLSKRVVSMGDYLEFNPAVCCPSRFVVAQSRPPLLAFGNGSHPASTNVLNPVSPAASGLFCLSQGCIQPYLSCHNALQVRIQAGVGTQKIAAIFKGVGSILPGMVPGKNRSKCF